MILLFLGCHTSIGGPVDADPTQPGCPGSWEPADPQSPVVIGDFEAVPSNGVEPVLADPSIGVVVPGLHWEVFRGQGPALCRQERTIRVPAHTTVRFAGGSTALLTGSMYVVDRDGRTGALFWGDGAPRLTDDVDARLRDRLYDMGFEREYTRASVGVFATDGGVPCSAYQDNQRGGCWYAVSVQNRNQGVLVEWGALLPEP